MPGSDAEYYALPDDAAGAQPSAMQQFLDSIAPGLSPPLTGGAAPLPSPYAAPPSPVNGSPAPAGSAFDPTVAAPDFSPVTLPQLQGPAPMQSQPPTVAPPAQGLMPGLNVPPPPKGRTLPTWLKALGALSSLSGGAGGAMLSNYIQQGDAKDQAHYQNQLQNYQLQNQQQQQALNDTERAQATQDREKQQATENQQSQAQSLQSLMKQMAGMDDDTQEKFVQNLSASPGLMSVYGLTPDGIKGQFYGADGTFQPVGDADTGKQATALATAQARASAGLFSLDPAAQQNIHDNSTPDEWEQRYGVPYDGFKPGMTQRNDTSAASQQSRAAVQQAQADLARARAGGVASDIKIKQAQLAEAVRRDTLAHGDRQSGQAVTERGQDLAHEDRQATTQQRGRIAASLLQFRMNKATGNPNAFDGLKPQQVFSDRARVRTELMNLREQGQKLAANMDLSDTEKASQMGDIAAQTRQAQGDYNQLDAMYQGMTGKGGARAAVTPMNIPPMPVSPGGPVLNGRGVAMPGVSVPRAPALPAFNGAAPNFVFRDRAGNPTAIGPSSGFGVATSRAAPKQTPSAAALPAAQRSKMSNAQFAQYFARRIAAKFGGK